MATQVQRRRGTTVQHATFIGALAETTIDTDKKTVVVHDGVTVGGNPLATEASVTAHLSDTTAAHAASAISIVDTGAYFTGTDVEAALQELGAATPPTIVTGEVASITITNGTNVTSSTGGNMLYTRVGNYVTFTFYCTINVTAASTMTYFTVALPIASNFTTGTECLGNGTFTNPSNTTMIGGVITAETVTDTMDVAFYSSGSTGNHQGFFTGMYKII